MIIWYNYLCVLIFKLQFYIEIQHHYTVLITLLLIKWKIVKRNILTHIWISDNYPSFFNILSNKAHLIYYLIWFLSRVFQREGATYPKLDFSLKELQDRFSLQLAMEKATTVTIDSVEALKPVTDHMAKMVRNRNLSDFYLRLD